MKKSTQKSKTNFNTSPQKRNSHSHEITKAFNTIWIYAGSEIKTGNSPQQTSSPSQHVEQERTFLHQIQRIP